MECTYVPTTKALTLKITEEIDEHTTEKLRRKIDNEISRFMPRKVIFDFSNVVFMDSAGIGMLLGRYKLVRMLGGELEIINVNRQIKKLFEMSGIIKIIKITDDLSDKRRLEAWCGLYDNEMKLEIISKSCNESFARIAVAAFASQLDPTIEELADIKTAVSEAVTNSIIHGYEGTDGIIKIECKIKDNLIEIEISDSGKGIENIELARKPLYTSKANLERSGMGFTIMENFMDELKVQSVLGLGTKIVMKKYINKETKAQKKENEIENEEIEEILHAIS